MKAQIESTIGDVLKHVFSPLVLCVMCVVYVMSMILVHSIYFVLEGESKLT